MPESEEPVQFVFVGQDHNRKDDSCAHQNVKPSVLVMSDISAPQGEQEGFEKVVVTIMGRLIIYNQFPDRKILGDQPLAGRSQEVFDEVDPILQ